MNIVDLKSIQTVKRKRQRILKKVSFGRGLLLRSSWMLTDTLDSFLTQIILIGVAIIVMAILILKVH